MLIDFFYALKKSKVPVSIQEFLTLLEALKKQVIAPSINDFYYLARISLVKDEKFYDRYDRTFSAYFNGIENLLELYPDIPLEWLEEKLKRDLTPEEKNALEKFTSPEELIKRLKELLDEQKERHEGGKKWIGTGGASAFGNNGYHPEGVRIGGKSAGNRTAIKVWGERNFADYDDSVELGTRNIKIALRRLRRFAREGQQTELDLDQTITATATNAGFLDIKMRPERHNQVKVLLLMDVGGSMDDHIARVEELFSAASSEFKHLEHYYFHNCLYDFVWKNNRRRTVEKIPTIDILRKYGSDYKLIFVGDATMSPYEILAVGGSVEYSNNEPGATWINRMLDHFTHHAWLNPEPEHVWQYRQSVSIIKDLMKSKMYPVTIQGLESAMRDLSK
jgi:uncharacterized protein with von Willebrand factor type A (vWA) domain